MKTAILACKALEDEVTKALEITGKDYPVFYPEKNLHDWPDNLRAELQKQLDEIEGYGRVLLGFAFCGNAVMGLRTGDFEMIVPRIDDCVSLLFGSIEDRAEQMDKVQSVYYTRGMLENEGGFKSQFEHIAKKRGEKRAWETMGLIYEHQDQITVLDDGAYKIDQVLPEAEMIAEKLHKQLCIKKVSVKKICDLLTGPWDAKNYLIVPPDSIITETMMYY